MSYTLEQLSADCHAAMVEDNAPAGRDKIRGFVSKACLDDDFIATYLGPDNEEDRKILYEDPDFGFCILAHVYKGPKASTPHDHGDYWAIYSQVEGETEMTQWKCIEKPADGNPGKVEIDIDLRFDADQTTHCIQVVDDRANVLQALKPHGPVPVSEMKTAGAKAGRLFRYLPAGAGGCSYSAATDGSPASAMASSPSS